MADMFGGPVGTSAYDKDYREAVHVGTQAIESLGRTAMQPAQKRLLEAHATQAELEAAEHKAAAELMRNASMPVAGGAPGAGPAGNANPFTLSTFFNQQASVMARAGLPKQAQELAKTASTLMQQEASTLSSNTTARLNQLKIIGERSEMLGQLFGSAKDQPSWDRSNALFEFQTGQPSPYRGVQFNPALSETIRNQALTMKERLQAEDRKLAREATERHQRATEGAAATNITIARERLDLEREREARLAKLGGKGAAGTPTEEERKEVKRLMRLDGIDTEKLDTDSLNSTAFSVASRARELQQENRGLGRQQAITRAFEEVKAAGDLEISTTGGVDLPLIGQVGGKRKLGRDPAAQLPSAARSALKEGVEVTFANGQTWTLEKGKAKRVK